MTGALCKVDFLKSKVKPLRWLTASNYYYSICIRLLKGTDRLTCFRILIVCKFAKVTYMYCLYYFVAITLFGIKKVLLA